MMEKKLLLIKFHNFFLLYFLNMVQIVHIAPNSNYYSYIENNIYYLKNQNIFELILYYLYYI